jgi:hypothetical protein
MILYGASFSAVFFGEKSDFVNFVKKCLTYGGNYGMFSKVKVVLWRIIWEIHSLFLSFCLIVNYIFRFAMKLYEINNQVT